jgi:hypothetical protein
MKIYRVKNFRILGDHCGGKPLQSGELLDPFTNKPEVKPVVVKLPKGKK